MATPVNAVSTVLINGQREDLIDVIYNIDPYDTPFLSAIGKGVAKAITHEWQTDDLRAPAVNTKIEGEDATINAGTFTTMASNICQIVSETLQVTGTAEKVDKAGRKSELGYQLAKKGKEMKLDMEYMLVGTPLAKVTRSSSVAGQAGNIYSYYRTNGSMGAGATLPTGNGATAGVAGTLRPVTETLVLNAAEKIWQEGGQANQIQVNSTLKKYISDTFLGRATEVHANASDVRVSQAVDIYECDFGKYTIKLNRWFKNDALFMFDPKMHSLCYLRPFTQFPLAKTGDSEKRQMLTEYTLRVNNEKSGALIRDLTTA